MSRSDAGAKQVPTSPQPTPGEAKKWLPWRLRTVLGGTERTFLLRPGATVLGSLADCDIVLPVAGVSRRHARLESVPDGLRLEDLGSRNGTFLRGEEVRGDFGAVVRAGDRLRLGPLALHVEPVAPGDRELVFEFPNQDLAKDGPAEEGDASGIRTRPGPTAVGSGYLALVTVAELLRGGAPLGQAVAGFGARVGVEGITLGLGRGREGPRVLASWGAAGEEGEVARVTAHFEEARAEGATRSFFRRAHHGTILHLAGLFVGTSLLDVVVRGELDEVTDVEALLEGFLRLVALHLPTEKGLGSEAADSRLGPRLRLPPGIVPSEAPAMRQLYDRLAVAALSSVRILLLGETGVGKEHLARAVHETSSRHNGPWVALNCAALAADLLESELFGIERGVATGVERRRGAFRQADRGTLFLDEIGELAPSLQAKLLRALEEGEVRPVGGEPRPVDVRVVAATNLDIEEQVAGGSFRPDLYYRLAGCVLRVPPLRERREDIPALIEHFLRHHGDEASRAGRCGRGLSHAALEILTHRPWPGNVRQLEAEVRRLVWGCAPGQVIDSEVVRDESPLPEPIPTVPEAAGDLDLRTHVEAVEKRVIIAALRRTGGSQRQAAKLLGIARNTLAQKILKLGIELDT